jgi:pimeloyl-ACP methyl ester carboxylesterase
MSDIRPFRIEATETELQDLRRRLLATRWPEPETVDDWSQGVPLSYLQEVIDYWVRHYDWRSREARLNRFPQYKTRLGELDIHFIHVRSPHEHALPLLITHGWPGSVVEFQKILEPLTNPGAHGGDELDAFHVVCPSLPGYGFSDKPPARGYGVEKIAESWDELMARLGYEQYVAQGGDWGAAVTTQIGAQNRGRCRGIHLNMPLGIPRPDAAKNPTPAEAKALALRKHYSQTESGYAVLQSTRPQTLGYGLTDSPAGQAAWILEKFRSWTDCNGHPENVLSRDELLDNIMLYWLPANGASSARLYWESFRKSFATNSAPVCIPTGCSLFARELSQPPREWVERRYSNVIYWNELPKGGHFAAFELPALFVEEVRRCFRLIRAALNDPVPAARDRDGVATTVASQWER